MSSIATQEVLAFAHELADIARAAILPYFRAEAAIENKAETGFDPVTAADKAAEEAMRAKIRADRPHDSIVGEEFDDHDGSSGWTWVLDPIDGTRAFIAGTAAPFDGPILDQAGKTQVAQGATAPMDALMSMQYFVKGVQGTIAK